MSPPTDGSSPTCCSAAGGEQDDDDDEADGDKPANDARRRSAMGSLPYSPPEAADMRRRRRAAPLRLWWRQRVRGAADDRTAAMGSEAFLMMGVPHARHGAAGAPAPIAIPQRGQTRPAISGPARASCGPPAERIAAGSASPHSPQYVCPACTGFPQCGAGEWPAHGVPADAGTACLRLNDHRMGATGSRAECRGS